MAVQQRQVAGIALIAAGLYVQSQRQVRTVVVEAPPRGVAKELLKLIDELNAALEQAIQETDQVAAAAQAAYQQLAELYDAIMSLAASLEALQAQLTEILALINGALDDLDALGSDVQDALGLLDQLQAVIGGDAAPLIAQLRQMLEDAQARIRELETALEELRRRVEAALQTVNQILAMVREILQDFESVLSALQTLVSTAEQLRQTLAQIINTLSTFAYYLEEVDVKLTVTTGQTAPFHTHTSQTATIEYQLDVWPSLGHCASAWVQVWVGNTLAFQRYNRSCCSWFRCWEACLDAPGCHQASGGRMVGDVVRFTLPGGLGYLRAYGGDDQADRAYAKATLTFRTIRLFVE